MKCKTTARDRKDTPKATPIHEDSQAGLDFILKFGQDAYDKLNKEVDEENDILQNLRDLNADINDEYMMKILIYLNWVTFFRIFLYLLTIFN